MNILTEIINTKHIEVARLKSEYNWIDLKELAKKASPPRDFLDSLRRPGIRVIAEIKQASPSAGILRSPFDPDAIAKTYQENGAACLSVLTDSTYFHGTLSHLALVRNTVSLPLLRKDFIIDAFQVLESRAFGADAILLIAEILNFDQLQNLHKLSSELGMATLIELHSPESVPTVKALKAPLVGINNRDLRTFKTCLKQTLNLANSFPPETVIVSESGIGTPSDVNILLNGGVKTFLIGESLLRAPDPGKQLAWLLGTNQESTSR